MTLPFYWIFRNKEECREDERQVKESSFSEDALTVIFPQDIVGFQSFNPRIGPTQKSRGVNQLPFIGLSKGYKYSLSRNRLRIANFDRLYTLSNALSIFLRIHSMASEFCLSVCQFSHVLFQREKGT